MNFFKKKGLCVALGILVITVCVMTFKNASIISTWNKSSNTQTIIVDAGHGGFDGGAVAPDGTVE